VNHRMYVVLGLVVLTGSGCAADVGSVLAPVVNGRLAAIAEIHGTVAIPIGAEISAESPDVCTGTLIRPNVVLTAAHCFFESDADNNPTNTRQPDSDFRVAAGVLDVRDATGDQLYGASRVVIHPGYDNTAEHAFGPAANDVALIVTERNVTQVAVVPFLSEAERARLAMDATVTVTGYGSTFLDAMGEPQGTGTLNTAEVFVAELSETELFLSSAGGQDTCPGDSGGPAYLFIDGAPRLVGVTSRADSSAMAACGEGGIYSLPHAFAAWIDMEVGPAAATGGCSAVPGRGRSLPLLALVLGLVLAVSRGGRRRGR
jgi:V8-like Glu-specific endopeptidase